MPSVPVHLLHIMTCIHVPATLDLACRPTFHKSCVDHAGKQVLLYSLNHVIIASKLAIRLLSYKLWPIHYISFTTYKHEFE